MLLLAAHFGVPVCPHAGGVGLCELTQHLSIVDYICVGASLDGRVLEYVDHLHEHFVDPVRMRGGHYLAPEQPGYSAQIKAAVAGRVRVPGRRRMEVLIASPMTPEDAERIAAEEGVELTYRPELLPTRKLGRRHQRRGRRAARRRALEGRARARRGRVRDPGEHGREPGRPRAPRAAARVGAGPQRRRRPGVRRCSGTGRARRAGQDHGHHLLRRPRRAAGGVRDPRAARVRQGPAAAPALAARAPLAGGPDAGRRAARARRCCSSASAPSAPRPRGWPARSACTCWR